MKHLILVLVAVVLAGCEAPNSDGQKDSKAADTNNASKNKGPFDQWQAEYQDMVEVLQLSSEESAALKRIFEKHVDIYDKWDAEFGDEYRQSFKGVMNAAKSKDLSKMRKLSPNAQNLRKQYLKILKDKETGVVNALPKIKQDVWRGNLISRHFFELASEMKFSKEQQTNIREAAITAAGKKAGEANPKAAGFYEFEKTIERTIFDQAQREQYKKIKDKNKLRTLTF